MHGRSRLVAWEAFYFLDFSFQNSNYLLQALTSQIVAASHPTLDMFYGLLEIAKYRGTVKKAEVY